MTESLPATAVVRVSRGTFDPDRFTEVDAANKKTSEYLVPAISALPGLLDYHVGISAQAGSIVHISIWDTDENAARMSRLTEMTVVAAAEMTAVGVTFAPIVNYPISWTI